MIYLLHSFVHPMHYIDKAIICQSSNDADHISEEVLYSLDGRLKLTYLKVSTLQNFRNEGKEKNV
jgi:hypothetical protein